MQHSHTKVGQKIEFRRGRVSDLACKGFKQIEICKMLDLPKQTISRDVTYLKREANESIRNHIDERLPYEYNKCLQGLDDVLSMAWITAANADKADNDKIKLQSLSLIKDSYFTKMKLLTDASLMRDSVRFVQIQKEELSVLVSSTTNNITNNGSNNNNMDYTTAFEIVRSQGYHVISKYHSREKQLEQWNQAQLEKEEKDRQIHEKLIQEGLKVDGAGISKNRDDYETEEQRNEKIQKMLERYKNETITE